MSKSQTSTHSLEFDFNFSDLEYDTDDNDIALPYQWDTNIQFVNIDVDTVSFKKRASNSFHTHFDDKQSISISTHDDDNDDDDDDDNDDENTKEYIPSRSRQISTFSPPLYDICSIICAPLSIQGIDNNNTTLESLEYIRSYLPDSSEFNEYLCDILCECGYKLRIANYIGTVDNISETLWNNGGSKIVHFIAYICNPFDEYCDDALRNTFPNTSYYEYNTDYILIETASFMNGCNGKWIKVDDLKRMIKFDCDLNDIMITISPQCNTLCDIFRNTFGYKYVIGVESLSNNYNTFACSETAIFLKYFYSSILHQECLDRAFELAKTAAILQRTHTNQYNHQYILLTQNDDNSARFVAFPHLIEGTVHNIGGRIGHNQYLRRHIIRPFLGRAQDVIDLIQNTIENKVSLVIGDDNNGRSAVIQNTVRYLLQHLYFGSCFIIDLEDINTKDKRNKYSLIERIYDVLCDEIEIECDDNVYNLNNNMNTKEFTKHLFRKLNNDPLFDSLCFVILNVDKWNNDDEIYEFIDIFNTETNDKCRAILSTDLNRLNLSSIHISALNREYISRIFIALTRNYNIINVTNHNKLHTIFGGSPRTTKRVAEFVNSESDSLTLDEIAIGYPQSAFAKTVYTTKQLLTVSIPQKQNLNMNPYNGWNTSFEHKQSDIHHLYKDHSFSLNLVQNIDSEFPFWNISYSASHRNESIDTYNSTDYDTCSDYDYDEEEEEVQRQHINGVIYRNKDFLSVKSVSTDCRLTSDGLRKHLSPRAHRRHNTYSIPDFYNEDPITHIFTLIPEIAETTQESIDFDIVHDEHGCDDEYSSFPDISSLKNRRFEIIISDEHCNSLPLPLTPLTPDKKALKKESITVSDITDDNRRNESMDFDGLSIYTTSTRHVSMYNKSHCSIERNKEYPLQLSPKDSDEPVIELNLAQINDIGGRTNDDKTNKSRAHSITMSGYNSGSTSDTLNEDTPSPMYRYESYDDYDDLSQDDLKKRSIAVYYGVQMHHTHNMSFSNHELHDVTDTLSLKLMKPSCIDDDDDDDDEAPLPLPLPLQYGNDIHLNVFAHLSRCKDADARAIWLQSATGSQYNQYAYLYRLYPFLVKKFQLKTRTKKRHPQLAHFEHYLLVYGGKYLRNTDVAVIHITKYNAFYTWFVFMCDVVYDLRQIYDDYNLECLFYGASISSQILAQRPLGTFVLSFGNQLNSLCIKYIKYKSDSTLSCIMLVRHSADLYSVNKSKTKASLYQIIRPRTYLKCLYTPQMLIDKKALF